MHGFARGARKAALPAVAAAALAGSMTAGTASAAPRPPAWCKPGGTLSARTMPEQVRIADCDLRGRTVRGPNGLAAVVPADGSSLVAHALRTSGAAELRIGVDDRAGKITIRARGGRVPQGRPRAPRAPLNPCSDGAYQLEPSKWPKGSTVQWRYHPGTAGHPRDVITKGVANMASANTDCTSTHHFTPPPDISESNTGDSATGLNVTASATCGTRDQVSTFGWQSMDRAENDVLAATCIWYEGAATLETDMALQEHGKQWWTGGTCTPGSYSAEAVATHEAGHVFGLSHVEGTDHSNLTMAPSVAACDNAPATLGKGDYDGLIALYGPN